MESGYDSMPYNNGVSTSVYNTRRNAYLNNYNENSRASSGVTTRSRHAYEDNSGFDFLDKLDQKPSSTRKRANTSSSGSGDKQRTANKICRVCGDKAFSYNFNVITCESCKAFFRRNANKEKEIRCPFNESCEINVVSRRFCQRCRLAKCFDVGMKKEWIMSDEARAEKKQRVEENRERRLQYHVQDALNRTGDDDDEHLDDDDDSMDDGKPHTTVLEYVTAKREAEMVHHSPMQLTHHPGPPPQQQQLTGSSSSPQIGYDYAPNSVAVASPLCASLQLFDPIPTTGAGSMADVSATTTSMPSIDIDPAKTMTSNGFIPPSVAECAVGSVQMADIVPVVATNPVAQAQLAVQAQAALNHHQQQIAAAVVAQQVVAQITAPTTQAATVLPPMQQAMVPPLPQPLPQAMNAPILAPPVGPSNTVLMNPLNPTQLPNITTEMVTIPREMLLELIQNNTLRSVTCLCKCVCGRYPPGSIIVNEVTKDLLAAGSANNAVNPEQKEEQRLETAEDFQRNGLLPSEDSSVQWLNTDSAIVDPSIFSDEISSTRRDSIYNSDMRLSASEGDFELTNEEKEYLEEVNNVANWWMEYGLDSLPLSELINPDYLSKVIHRLTSLVSFKKILVGNQKQILENGVYNYLIVKWLQHHESISLEGIEPQIAEQIGSLLDKVASELRMVPGAFNTLSILSVFDVDVIDFTQQTGLHAARETYERLLQKLFHSNGSGIVNTSDFAQLTELLPAIRRAANCLRSISFNLDDPFLQSLFAQDV